MPLGAGYPALNKEVATRDARPKCRLIGTCRHKKEFLR